MFESIEFSKVILFLAVWILLGLGAVAFNYACGTVSDPSPEDAADDSLECHPECSK